MEKSRKIIESFQVVSITTLKSSEGLKLSEAKIDTSKSMLVVIDAIRAGMTANYHNFLPSALSAAAASYYTPYHKPLIKNHDSYSAEPLGRIFDAKYIPETQTVRVWAYVSDEEAIEKIKDGRYSTVSIGAMAADARCSMCGHDYFAGECQHWAGRTYEDSMCMVNIYECEFSELSFVNVPACQTAGVVDFGGEVPNDLREPDHVADMAMSDERVLVLAESAGTEQPLKVTEIADKHKDLHLRFEAAKAAGEDLAELIAEHGEMVKLMKANHMHHSQLDELDESIEEPVAEEPAAEPTEPAAEPVAEEPAAEPAAEPVEEPAAEPVEPAEEPVAEEPVEEPAADPVEEPAAEPVAEPTEPAAEPAEEPAAEPVEPTVEPVAEPAAEPVEPVLEAAVVPQAIEPEKTATLQTEATLSGEGLAENGKVNVELQQKVESLGSENQKLRNELEALGKANADMAVMLHNALTDRVIELKLSMDLLTTEETEAARQSLQFRSVETLSTLVEELDAQKGRQSRATVQQQPISGVSVAEKQLVEVPTLVTEAGQTSATPEQTAEELYTEQVRSALKPRKR